MGKRLPSDCGDHGGVVSRGSAAIIAGTNFTSGALFSDAKRDAAAAAEAARLQALKSNEELPLVYLDVAIKGRPIGRIHFVLFTKEAPRAGVQNCTDSGRQSIKIRSACCHGFPAQIIIAAAVRYGATAHFVWVASMRKYTLHTTSQAQGAGTATISEIVYMSWQ